MNLQSKFSKVSSIGELAKLKSRRGLKLTFRDFREFLWSIRYKNFVIPILPRPLPEISKCQSVGK